MSSRGEIVTGESEPSGDAADPAVFRVLGPLTIVSGGEALVLPPSKVISLLATLLLHPDDVVSTSALQEAIWGDNRPESARAALQTCTLRLRQMFVRHGITGTTIETVPGGYRITATADNVDLVRFRELVSRARAESDPQAELAGLEEALTLWNGPVLANVPSEFLHRDVVPRIVEERTRVVERVCDLKIRLGWTRSALVDLWAATRAHPANERFAAQLVEVLYQTGRQADALAELRRIRDRLDHELGVQPGPALRSLELTILRGERLGGKDTAVSASPERITDTSAFVGRDALCKGILERLSAGTTLLVLSGPAGVGKSALARCVAHRAADLFPGGRLLIAMRSADGTPIALEHLPSAAPPAGRRLIVLDDVADAAQALHLPNSLPPGDVLLLTSRTSLTGLVARYGGWLHRVEPLDAQESRQLLAGVLGTDRMGAEPDAGAALAELCEHLPLALRVAATRLLLRSRMPLADAVAWLATDRIGRLSPPGERDMSLRARFDDALAQAGPTLAAAVRTLAGEPGAITVESSAAALCVPPAATRSILDELVDHGLLDEDAAAYRMGGLLRQYAGGFAAAGPIHDGPYATRIE